MILFNKIASSGHCVVGNSQCYFTTVSRVQIIAYSCIPHAHIIVLSGKLVVRTENEYMPDSNVPAGWYSHAVSHVMPSFIAGSWDNSWEVTERTFS